MEVYYPINWSAFFAHLATAVVAAAAGAAVFFCLCRAIFPFSFSTLSAGFCCCCCMCSCVLLLENDSSCVSTLCARTLIPLDLLQLHVYGRCHGVLVARLLICYVVSSPTLLCHSFPSNIDLVQNWSVLRLLCMPAEHTTLWTCNEWLPLRAQSATLRQIILFDAFFFALMRCSSSVTFYSWRLLLLLPSIKCCSRVCVDKCCC